MNRRTVLIALLGVIIILAGVGYYAVFREPEAPSAPIEAIPLEPEPTEEVAEAPEPTEEPTEAPEPTEEPTEEAAEEPTEAPEPTEEPTEEAEPTEEPAEEAMEDATEEATEEPAEETAEEGTEEPEAVSSTGAITFEIASDQSSSRFELDEDLRGERITVVGTSDQVAAQLRLDPTDLSTTQVGTVLVNARAFVTDSDFRNRAIHNRILMTGEYEFITFEPTELVGLPESAAVGETINFDIIGNLTIRDITQQATFATSVTAESESSLTGSASTVIQLVDYDLNIPEVPNVANVEEEVELYIDFVANALDAPSGDATNETEDAAETEESEGSEAEGEAEEAAEEASEEATEEPAEEGSEESAEEAAEEPEVAASTSAITFEIASDQSSSRFELDEDLRGERITVVGTSDQVAAQLRFDPTDLSTAQVGTVLVNARAFVTDSDFRNRAIHNRILMTGEYEFITFEPTELVGLPASAAVGEPVNFDIIGNLTIRDITQQVTFATSVTAQSESSITGSASTVIQLADYDLNIPEVPSVANVEEELELYIDFVANAIN